MFYIDYNEEKNRIELEYWVNDTSDKDFDDHNNFCKFLYVQYDFTAKKRYLPLKDLDVFLLWCKRDNFDYSFSTIALEKFEQFRNETYKQETRIARNLVFDPSILTPHTSLFDYQVKTVNHHLMRNRVLNSLSAGLGKSLISICYFTTLYTRGLVDKIIIIVPIGMSYHWKSEILDKVKIFKEEDILIIDNKNKVKPFDNNQDKKIFIMSNHIIDDIFLSYREKAVKKGSKPKWKNYVNFKNLFNTDKLFLLVDESHQFKNSDTIRSKALNSVVDDFEYREFATATSMTQYPEEGYSNFSMLDKGIIPMSEKAFKIWIADKVGNRFSSRAIESYNIDNFSKFLDNTKTVFIKLLKEDVPEMKTKKLPPEIIRVELHPLQRELYEIVCQQEVLKIVEEYDNVTWNLLLNKSGIIFQALDCPTYLLNNYTNPAIDKIKSKWKFEYDNKFQLLKYKLKDVIDDQGEKQLVFCQYPYNLDLFGEEFKKYNPIVIHGQIDVKDKELLREQKRIKFNKDKSCSLACLSTKTSSAGGNWNESCNRLLMYSLPWSATLTSQASDRTSRINSTNDTIWEIFSYPKTLDELRLRRALNRIELNDKLGTKIEPDELKRLLNGIL